MSKKEILESTIESFLEVHTIDTFPQGSKEWLEGRLKCIGCSEHYNATNTKSSKRQVIKSKVNKTFQSSLATEWGSLWEDTTRRICEIYFNTSIIEADGNIMHSNGINSCSPDGLGIVNFPNVLFEFIQNFIKNNTRYTTNTKNRFVNYITIEPDQLDVLEKYKTNINRDNHVITLFEFKTPYSRELTKRIHSETYTRQVLIGMDIIDICLAGLFIECDIKSCTIESLYFNDKRYLDRYYVEQTNENPTYGNPNMIGIKYHMIPVDQDIVLYENHYEDGMLRARLCGAGDDTPKREGLNSIDIDSPVFIKHVVRKKDMEFLNKMFPNDNIVAGREIIIMEDFGFTKSLENYTDSITCFIIQTLIDDINPFKTHTLINERQVNEFLVHLLDIMEEIGCFKFTPWKLMATGISCLPRIEGLTQLWQNECNEIIQIIERIKDIDKDDIDSVIKTIDFQYN